MVCTLCYFHHRICFRSDILSEITKIVHCLAGSEVNRSGKDALTSLLPRRCGWVVQQTLQGNENYRIIQDLENDTEMAISQLLHVRKSRLQAQQY